MDGPERLCYETSFRHYVGNNVFGATEYHIAVCTVLYWLSIYCRSFLEYQASLVLALVRTLFVQSMTALSNRNIVGYFMYLIRLAFWRPHISHKNYPLQNTKYPKPSR
jgi:hypothetical protein